MSSGGRLKFGGRYISQKQFSRKKKCAEGLRKFRESLKRAHENSDEPKGDTCGESSFACKGRRIVDVEHISKQMRCEKCGERLALEDIRKEEIVGLLCSWFVSCSKCSTMNRVQTDKSHYVNDAAAKALKYKKKITHGDGTTKAVLATLASGKGCTELNKVLACLNVPQISHTIYKRYEREVGPAIEKAARESCNRAAHEERQLVIDKIEELCENLPSRVSEEIKIHVQKLKDANVSADNFNKQLGTIIKIIVTYDMGWSKRGNGRSYDSLNGYGAILGFLTGKILDYKTRNRKCQRCDAGRSPSDHDCRLNHYGSAGSMEADVAAQLVNNSNILEENYLDVVALVGDEDCKAIKKVNDERSIKVLKICDKNHLKKNIGKELYALAKSGRELGKQGVIPHIQKCFAFAIEQNKNKPDELAAALSCLPEHFYDKHQNCGSWCKKDDHTVSLKNELLRQELTSMCNDYAKNSAKFATAGSTQGNESFNGMVIRTLPKTKCLSKSESADYRVGLAVLNKNEGNECLMDINQNLNVSPGLYTSRFAKRSDMLRAKKAEKSRTIGSKIRRKILQREREKLRKANRKVEGIVYQSNMGIRGNRDKFSKIAKKLFNIEFFEKELNVQLNLYSLQFMFVYFDLETSGFGESEILQIAAKCGIFTFTVYVKPSKAIDPSASKITGLSTSPEGELLYKGNPVESVPIHSAMHAFLEFLKQFPKPCLLVAHNCGFDQTSLVREIQGCSMTEAFSKVIVGFSDSLSLLRKEFPERKQRGQCKLETLTTELLGVKGDFHEALCDVLCLEAICCKFLTADSLGKNMKSFAKVCENVSITTRANSRSHLFLPLKNVLSSAMFKKLASKDFTYESLKQLFEVGGKQSVKFYLSEKINKKPRLTSNQKILDKIAEHFEIYV